VTMTTDDTSVALAARAVSRRFGATTALNEASIELRRGEVHALLGENGAGKSTLVKILVGADRPDGGVLEMDGRPVAFTGVSDAVSRGVVPIYQQLSLMPQLSIVENLFAFQIAEGAGWRRTRRDWTDQARHALQIVGLDLDPDTVVEELSLAERQLVEIARSVLIDCQVLVLDEPTTALTVGEIDQLFAVMNSLRERGRAVLFISHRLDEVMSISDRISVLRNGRSEILGVPARGLSADEVIHAMVGREVESSQFDQCETGPCVLEAKGLASAGSFTDVSLRAHAGEVVAVVGLIGSGAIALAEVLAGSRAAHGSVTVSGRRLALGDRTGALQQGVGYLPGDRDRDGVFPTLTVLQNASACSLDTLDSHGVLRQQVERERLDPMLRSLATKPDSSSVAITALSGGNQQKVMVARMLARPESKVFVMIEPTRGVDIGSRRDIHETIRRVAAEGAAVVVASTDLDEVSTLADRVLVMRDGALVAEVEPAAGPRALLARMTGAVA
jgi:ABC-type sugar transport system ATPase subunit